MATLVTLTALGIGACELEPEETDVAEQQDPWDIRDGDDLDTIKGKDADGSSFDPGVVAMGSAPRTTQIRVGTGFCLEWNVADNRVTQQVCQTGRFQQQWVILEMFDWGNLGYVSIRAPGNLCLDLPGWTSTLPAAVQLFQCNGGSNQRFYRVGSPSSGTLHPAYNFKCLDIAWGNLPGQRLQQAECNGGTNQHFDVSGGHSSFYGYTESCNTTVILKDFENNFNAFIQRGNDFIFGLTHNDPTRGVYWQCGVSGSLEALRCSPRVIQIDHSHRDEVRFTCYN